MAKNHKCRPFFVLRPEYRLSPAPLGHRFSHGRSDQHNCRLRPFLAATKCLKCSYRTIGLLQLTLAALSILVNAVAMTENLTDPAGSHSCGVPLRIVDKLRLANARFPKLFLCE
jgi:hypothetical protein